MKQAECLHEKCSWYYLRQDDNKPYQQIRWCAKHRCAVHEVRNYSTCRDKEKK